MAQAVTFLACLCLLPSLGLCNLSLREAPDTISYQKFHIDTLTVARYAVTTVTSVISNRASEPQQLNFQVQLPETAFISSFTMTVNDTTYNGVAKEKEEAQQEFDDRVAAGENVGLVESRGTNVFQIRINTAANTNSTFMLNYEELIPRRASRYTQILNLNPGRIVEDFRATVRVIDEQGLINTEGSSYLTKDTLSDREVFYSFSPTAEEQNDETFGLARDLEVKYDVNHPDSGPGIVTINDCYFAQFFSPANVERIPVDLVFVIDVSGSMSGTKIEQTKEALRDIINNELRPTDRFAMVRFESEVFVWENNGRVLNEANAQNKEAGIAFVDSLVADGGTNFNEGLQRGISILKATISTNIPLIVMLTDGEPTVGVTQETDIIANARNAVAGTRISVNCLGFGFSLNFALLERLSIENNGIVRRIYEAEDAVQQLEGFFEEISSPILHTIRIIYPQNVYETISKVEFPLLFAGSELVVAGKFSASVCENPETVEITVTGTGSSGELSFTGTVNTGESTTIAGFEPSTERLVAYLLIQQLLDQRLLADTDEEKDVIEARALALALNYNFVTELTSLIVVEENGMGNITQTQPGQDLGLERDAFFPAFTTVQSGRGGCPPLKYTPVLLTMMIVGALLLLA